MSRCDQVCLVCNEPSRYYFVNKAEYHALCFNCAQSIQIENIECKICSLNIRIDYLLPDENAVVCSGCNKNITAKLCPSKTHKLCLSCRKDECRLCKCEFCGKKSQEMADHGNHSICGTCYHKYGLCPFCICINCKIDKANFKHHECNHPCCHNCRYSNCKLCIKICAICKKEGDHKAKRCDNHFYCFTCFGIFGKVMGQKCLICIDDRTYKCIKCEEYDINAKSLCDTPHIYCSKCRKTNMCYCEFCSQCHKTLECNYCNQNKHRICQSCKSTGRCELCEEYERNYALCSNCGNETTIQNKFDCGADHFACKNCLEKCGCNNCLKYCCNCNEAGYWNLICPTGHWRCNKQECSSAFFGCQKHFDCPGCVKVKNCEHCINICGFCFRDTYTWTKCTNSHVYCKECPKLYECGSHYECPGCFQPNESRCKICMTCSNCKNRGISFQRYEHCVHIYCDNPCKENNGLSCNQCITCDQCNQVSQMNSLQKVCQNCKELVRCKICDINPGNLPLECQNHKICSDCNQTFKMKCPICLFKIFNSGVCDSCNLRTSDFSILDCNSHKVCQKCLEKNNQCLIYCSQCREHLIGDYKKLRCSHYICRECKPKYKSGKKVKCGICCIHHKNEDGQKCVNCMDLYCKSCYSEYQNRCKKCKIKCEMCEKEARFFCNDPNHGLCSDHSYNTNQCLFCNNYFFKGQCYECDQNNFVAFSGCKHSLCFICNTDFNNGCSFCRNSICKLCKKQVDQLHYSYTNEDSNTGLRCCSDCICSKCNKIIGIQKYECGHNLCSACRSNENCPICYIKCAACKIETKNLADCRHMCLDCCKKFQNISHDCIFCANEYSKYQCHKCSNFEPNIITKFMYCVNCLLEYQNNECHICHSNINSNDYQHRGCNFLLCGECNIYNTQIECPICKKVNKELCQICNENKYLYPVAKSQELFSCLNCSLTKKVTSDSSFCHVCSQVYKKSEYLQGNCTYCYKLCETCNQVYKNDDDFSGHCTICNNLCLECKKIYKKNESIQGGCPHCYRLCIHCKVNNNLIGCNYKNQEEFDERYCTDCHGIKLCNSCQSLFKPHDASKNNLCVNCNTESCSVCRQIFSKTELKDQVCEECSVFVNCTICKHSSRAVYCSNLESEHIFCQNCVTKVANCSTCRSVDYKTNLNKENICKNCIKRCFNCNDEKSIQEFQPNLAYCNKCAMYMTNNQKTLNAIFTCERCNFSGNEQDFSSQKICKSCKMKDLNGNKNQCNKCYKKYPGSTNDPDEICQCKNICNNCNKLLENEFFEFDCKHNACQKCSQNLKLEKKCPCCFDVYKCPEHPTAFMVFLKSDPIFYSNCCRIHVCSRCKKYYNNGHICT